jgi:predicted  nucleic acid-binding Zn-ribbon protein
MTCSRTCLAGCLLSLLLVSGAWAERRRDALTPPEIDQLRDTAQDPDERLKLYVKFARARLDAVEKARTDPKETARGRQVHDALQDFLQVYDELNDNIDTFADRKADIRKTLKTIMEADTEFQAKLRALKDSATASPGEAAQYEFVLANAVETLDSSAQDHRQLLTEQEELAKQKKLVKPEPQGSQKVR